MPSNGARPKGVSTGVGEQGTSFLSIDLRKLGRSHLMIQRRSTSRASRKGSKGGGGQNKNFMKQLEKHEKQLNKLHTKILKHHEQSKNNAERIKQQRTRLDQIHKKSRVTIKTLNEMQKLSGLIVSHIHSTDKNASNVLKELQQRKQQSISSHISQLDRMWANEDARIKYMEMRQARKVNDSHANAKYCGNEKSDEISVFSAVPLTEEEDETSCIGKNRDEMVQAFCNFRLFFDETMKDIGLKNGRHYWPNICCHPYSAATEGTDYCADKSGKILREQIIPFAQAQGGQASSATLYGEVKDAMEKGGYMHTGMDRFIDDISCKQKREYIKKIQFDIKGLSKGHIPKKWYASDVQFDKKRVRQWKEEDQIHFPSQSTYRHKIHGMTSYTPIYTFLEHPNDFVEILGSSKLNSFLLWNLRRQLKRAKRDERQSCLYRKLRVDLKLLGAIKKTTNDFFSKRSLLCGPKTFLAPPQQETKMCELFAPYKHMLASFRRGIEMITMGQLSGAKHTGFLELVESRQKTNIRSKATLTKKLLANKRKLWNQGSQKTRVKKRKGNSNKHEKSRREGLEKRSIPASKAIRSKDMRGTLSPKAQGISYTREPQCMQITGDDKFDLKKLKDMFCPIVQNLDVNDESVDNFAMLYIEDSFSPRKDETMAQLAERLKYDIKNDKDCSTPLFTPEDISMQRISLDSKRKSWVVIVKLDSKSKTSYIREAASCKSLPYLPTSSITVSVKQRVTKKKCPKNPIRRGFHGCKTYDVYIPMLHHHTKRPIGYEIDMKGTTFDFESTATSNAGIDNDDNDIPTRASTRRRRLLTQRWQGS